MHFAGFPKFFPIYAADISLALIINFTSNPIGYNLLLVQHYHYIQFFLVFPLAFLTACLLLSPVLCNLVSTFHFVWTLSHFTVLKFFAFLTVSISFLLKHIIFTLHRLWWSFAVLWTPGFMYNNNSYKFVQHKWRDSHTRCQVLLQHYLEELQEPWHW